jgi:manganese-dependent inorganic pyrophosphatase
MIFADFYLFYGGEMVRPVYVIGHKNPDVDSIAAAIGYQLFKQNTADGLFVAAAAGELNEESRFLLDYLGLEYPVIIKDVGTTVKICLKIKSRIVLMLIPPCKSWVL